MNVIKDEIRDAVEKELENAYLHFPMFSSLHEGYAVILEESEESEEELHKVNEYLGLAWRQVRHDEVKLALNHISRAKEAAIRLAIEACQVAAMCEKTITSMACKAEDSERSKDND